MAGGGHNYIPLPVKLCFIVKYKVSLLYIESFAGIYFRCQSNKQDEDTVPDYVYSNTDLNPTTSTTDDTLNTGYQNISTNTRNVDYVNQSFNTEDNTRNMYDTLDHTADDTSNTYTSIECNKAK
ncbi:hypothetical protein SNE40_012412 [Patella caerulea]|uniref:Uncharacterized protein n=1 Tax=Patella caerulea TaxID=87958 RepID=A0AAN8JPB9_PATCE